MTTSIFFSLPPFSPLSFHYFTSLSVPFFLLFFSVFLGFFYSPCFLLHFASLFPSFIFYSISITPFTLPLSPFHCSLSLYFSLPLSISFIPVALSSHPSLPFSLSHLSPLPFYSLPFLSVSCTVTQLSSSQSSSSPSSTLLNSLPFLYQRL